MDAISKGEPYNIVITELGMPRITGREVVQRIKEVSPNIPAIVRTGWDGESAPKEADAILCKTVRPLT